MALPLRHTALGKIPNSKRVLVRFNKNKQIILSGDQEVGGDPGGSQDQEAQYPLIRGGVLTAGSRVAKAFISRQRGQDAGPQVPESPCTPASLAPGASEEHLPPMSPVSELPPPATPIPSSSSSSTFSSSSSTDTRQRYRTFPADGKRFGSPSVMRNSGSPLPVAGSSPDSHHEFGGVGNISLSPHTTPFIISSPFCGGHPIDNYATGSAMDVITMSSGMGIPAMSASLRSPSWQSSKGERISSSFKNRFPPMSPPVAVASSDCGGHPQQKRIMMMPSRATATTQHHVDGPEYPKYHRELKFAVEEDTSSRVRAAATTSFRVRQRRRRSSSAQGSTSKAHVGGGGVSIIEMPGGAGRLSNILSAGGFMSPLAPPSSILSPIGQYDPGEVAIPSLPPSTASNGNGGSKEVTPSLLDEPSLEYLESTIPVPAPNLPYGRLRVFNSVPELIVTCFLQEKKSQEKQMEGLVDHGGRPRDVVASIDLRRLYDFASWHGVRGTPGSKTLDQKTFVPFSDRSSWKVKLRAVLSNANIERPDLVRFIIKKRKYLFKRQDKGCWTMMEVCHRDSVAETDTITNSDPIGYRPSNSSQRRKNPSWVKGGRTNTSAAAIKDSLVKSGYVTRALGGSGLWHHVLVLK